MIEFLLGWNFQIILENVVTKHVDLIWDVDFNKQTISGEAILHFDIVAKEIERIVSSCSCVCKMILPI